MSTGIDSTATLLLIAEGGGGRDLEFQGCDPFAGSTLAPGQPGSGGFNAGEAQLS